MPAVLDALTRGSALWLDSTAYAGRLLAGGRIPWLDATACAAWQRKAQGLLHSDVLAVPLAEPIAAWLAANRELAEAMAAKPRTTYALKTLLADEALRAHLVALVAALRGAVGALPLVLQLPSPRRWIALAHAQAHGGAEVPQIGADEIDSAAVLVADFLRSFGESAVDGLLLDEAAGDEPADAEQLAWYQPVLNVAAHYRWDVGLRLPEAVAFAGAVAGYAYVIAPRVLSGAAPAPLAGLSVPEAFWRAGTAAPTPAAGRFRHAQIPADSVPEQVLERIAALRAA